MRRRRYVRTLILLIGSLAVLVLATRADSAPPPPLAQQVGQPSKTELLTRCQQRPACRAKLDLAQKEQRPGAQRLAQSAVSLYLTPQIHMALSPYSNVELHAVLYAGGRHILNSGRYRDTTATHSKGRPFVAINFTAPTSGFYIINVRAGNAAANLLRGLGTIIETWASGSASCSAGICDYATMEYLQQGAHKFYFYSLWDTYQFYSVSIESYP